MIRLKFIKTIAVLLLSIILLSGCIANTFNSKAINKSRTITISASFYPIYIFLLNITWNIPEIKVVDMTKPITGCLHDYSLTTEDMKTLENSDIFVINGAGMEAFIAKVVKQQPNLKIIDSSTGIPLIKSENSGIDNPHLWVSISNALEQVKNIGEKLVELNPENAIKFKENTTDYISKLTLEREKMHATLDNVKNRDIITFHEAFPYFAKEFNLNIVGLIEREPGSEPNAKELLATIKIIEKSKVKALFVEPQYSAKAAQTIAKETGLKVYTLDPVVSGPMEKDAYINIMDSNLKTLQEALK